MKRILWLMICVCLSSTTGQAQRAFNQPYKVDEFTDTCCEDEKARLDYFATELQNSPEARGYIIYYGGRRYESCWYGGPHRGARRPRYGEAQARVARLKPYLVMPRGIAAERIAVQFGGWRESWTAELWVVPKGATPPNATPTVEPKEIRYRRGKVTVREFRLQCMEG